MVGQTRGDTEPPHPSPLANPEPLGSPDPAKTEGNRSQGSSGSNTGHWRPPGGKLYLLLSQPPAPALGRCQKS